MTLIDNGDILFAGHAERFSKKKNDWYNNCEIFEYISRYGVLSQVAYYEKPLLKKTRLFLTGNSSDWKPKNLPNLPVKYYKHHHSHAAAGYYTSPFKDAVIVVLDAIGEWNTSSIWIGSEEKISCVEKINYPFSFGLYYSAFTHLVGLKPNEEEYILMGMAAYGNINRYKTLVENYFPSIEKQKYNFHKGINDWPLSINEQDRFDIAAAVQFVYEQRLIEFMNYAKKITGKNNLVFMGGCALNCSANTKLWDLFEDIWIMPNPGDAGSSLGAAAALYGKHINWEHPYLGYDLGGKYPVDNIIDRLLEKEVAPVASGRAEYGPRALGNRSILADPRNKNIKNKVNELKQREMFRPFAPVILEEKAHEWFDMPMQSSPYMQYAVRCKKPDDIPGVVHEDGTSRVQTVNETQHAGLYSLLKEWYFISGVPILLNTSLNIKGQPLLNDENDIIYWNQKHKDNKIIT